MMQKEDVESFLKSVIDWAVDQPNIQALALVGSQARGTAREDSDIDLVIIANDPFIYLRDTGWIAHFGVPLRQQVEDYGLVQSLRVWYQSDLEVEYGLTDARWAALPLDEGTRRVVKDGMRVLFERRGILSQIEKGINPDSE